MGFDLPRRNDDFGVSMKRQWLNQKRVLVIVAFLLLVTSLLPGRVSSAIAYIPYQLVRAMIAPPGTMIRSIVGGDQEELDIHITEGGRDELEQRLGQAYAFIRQLELKVQNLETMIDRLTRTSERIELAGLRMVDARVASFSGNDSRPVIELERGSRKGIRKGQAVVHGFNLVGEVELVTAMTANVELINGVGSSLMVRLLPPSPGPAPRGGLETLIEYDPELEAFVVELGVNEDVCVDDLAHLIDSRWREESHGFIVGKVVKIDNKTDRPLLTRRVIIKPTVSLADLNRVTVLVPID